MWHKIQHVEPVKITSVPKNILDKYKEVTIWCDLMRINRIGLLNTISRHIIFATGSMIKNRKNENIADGIIQLRKLYLQCGFKITHIHADCKFEPIRKKMNALGINLKYALKNMPLKLSVSSGLISSMPDLLKPPCRSNEYPSLWKWILSPLPFLAQCTSPINTCCRNVRNKRYQKNSPW